jgi:galactokinase/tRNA pseudouridine(38-40) synthase
MGLLVSSWRTPEDSPTSTSRVRDRSEDDAEGRRTRQRRLASDDTRKTRKVAIFLAYSGRSYHGMQVNHAISTVEGTLLAAIEKCGFISGTGRESQSASQFSRAARTDKGVSAACQCVSMRLPCEFQGKVDERVKDAMNLQLPDDIRILAIVRATPSFSARGDCHRRSYEYLLPLQSALGGADNLEARPDGETGDARVARLNDILRAYEGTKCFANFTDGGTVKAGDAAAMRYMLSVKASEPFRLSENGVLYTSVVLRGQSFVYYQIRKMVGMALAIYSGVLSSEAMDVALSPHVQFRTPTAPAMFLFLDDLDFSAYNKAQGRNLPAPIRLLRIEEKNSFKRSVIYAEIDRDRDEMAAWMRSLQEHVRYDEVQIMDDHQRFIATTVGIEEERRRAVAAQYPVTRDVQEFMRDMGVEGLARLQEMLSTFRDWTGADATCVVRAPGRVNLIGEHLDYNDFPVIGIATRQGTLVAGALSAGDRVAVHHMESEACVSGSFDKSGSHVTNGSGEWSLYVSWGWSAMMTGSRVLKKGANVLFAGDLPRAAGLGSSSSLVTASTLIAARLSRVMLGREELALLAAEGERIGAGTRGGAVDHTICMCGAPSTATRVSFSPKLETSTLPLPNEGSFVVIQSGVKAFKGQHDGTKMQFNMRVIECRVGAALVARRLRTRSAKTVFTPGQLYCMERVAGRAATVNELFALVRTVTSREEEISVADAVRELGFEEDSPEWRKRYMLDTPIDTSRPLKIGRRLFHVFSEADRVDQFSYTLTQSSRRQDHRGGGKSADEQNIVLQLGALLSASHRSLRDDYECSVREVDDLVEFCLQSGSVGARITGAGWGGSIVSIVPKCSISSFVTKLSERVGAASVFVAEPSGGACVLAL